MSKPKLTLVDKTAVPSEPCSDMTEREAIQILLCLLHESYDWLEKARTPEHSLLTRINAIATVHKILSLRQSRACDIEERFLLQQATRAIQDQVEIELKAVEALQAGRRVGFGRFWPDLCIDGKPICLGPPAA